MMTELATYREKAEKLQAPTGRKNLPTVNMVACGCAEVNNPIEIYCNIKNTPLRIHRRAWEQTKKANLRKIKNRKIQFLRSTTKGFYIRLSCSVMTGKCFFCCINEKVCSNNLPKPTIWQLGKNKFI